MRGLRIAVWGTTQIVSPRGQNAGVFKDNGECLYTLLRKNFEWCWQQKIRVG